MEGTRTRTTRASLATVSLLALAATALVGCTSGSTKDDPGGSGNATGNADNAGNGKVSIFVIGGKSDDPFWSSRQARRRRRRQGGQGRRRQGHLARPAELRQPRPGRRQAASTALSARAPTAVVGPDWVPEAQDAAFKQVTARGSRSSSTTPAASRQAEERRRPELRRHRRLRGRQGRRRVLRRGRAPRTSCASTPFPAPANQEARCKGIAEGLQQAAASPRSSRCRRRTSATRPPSPRRSRPPCSRTTTHRRRRHDRRPGRGQRRRRRSSRASSATRSSSARSTWTQTQLERIKAGKQLFAIDQQPYLQGYLAVSMAIPTSPTA